MKKFVIALALSFVAVVLGAQPRQGKVQVILVPDHADALYQVGQQVNMKVTTLHCGLPLEGVNVKYEVSEDLMEPHISEEVTLKGYEGKIQAGTMKKPGFLRVKATVEYEGERYIVRSTVGFEPEKLRPVSVMPDDFDEFWKKSVAKLEKVKLDPKMELLEERCTDDVDVYHISYGNIKGSRMYGVLTVPKGEGKYPAILRFPGAGVGPKGGDIAHARKGVIVLELGIHGIPVNLEGSIYEDLGSGILSWYPEDNLNDPEKYYYHRVFLGAVQGIDFLQSLPQCNGIVGTFGGSQGGTLSIVTSCLDPRIKATVAYFPAMCDHEGYIHGRAGGWPHMFKNQANRTDEYIRTARYYDVSNFARGLKAPVCYLYGYNDITCAPTTTCATYNVIPAPKQVIIGENIGHWTYPEQMNALWEWIISTLKSSEL